eukprot:Nitzschia sp. Nitz4//scaffold376_size14603//4637//5710//NITZ4_008919-RA/size14603-processed-gene-0.12-mRNA-1//-1//CDS//3329549655//1645//frame0
MLFRSSFILLSLFLGHVAGHGQMSRHLVAEDLSMVVVMASATTTEGPFDEEVEDYTYDSNMTAAATAGSPGVTADRSSVLDGVPLELTITVYDLSTSSSGYANECGGVEVFLWHTDAAGVYSSVEQSRQGTEGTETQHWLRSYQTTGVDGKVTFNTILPGWYRGRVIHYHVRLRYSGSNSWAATSQFFVNDTALDMYSSLSPYSSNTQRQTSLSSDGIYNRMSSAVADLLVLNMQGSVANGFTAEIELGLGSTSSAALCSEYVGTAVPVSYSPVPSPTDNAPTIAPATPTAAPTADNIGGASIVPTVSSNTTTSLAPDGSLSNVDAAEGGSSDASHSVGHAAFGVLFTMLVMSVTLS